MSVKKLLGEFKAFAFKGNVIDLAVAIVIGVAFGAVVNSFVNHIIMPAVSYVAPAGDYKEWTIGRIQIGLFIGAVVNFLIIAMSVFLAIVKVRQVIVKPPPAAAPSTKECPACAMEIPAKASRCPHCTSDVLGGGKNVPV
jgi:large conductance mechanosensitive channel